MTVLVTGGAGFIGQHVARRLRADGHAVTALDVLLEQVHTDPAAAVAAFPGAVVVGDVADQQTWADLDPSGIDTVVHLAAETGTGQSMYAAERHRHVNVGGTRRAAMWARTHGAAFVLASSRAVYGEGRYLCERHEVTFGGRCCADAVPAPSRESDPHRPVSVYGETKSQAEAAALEICTGHVPLAIVRPQNVIGPGQSLHNPYTGVLAAFLAMLRDGRELTIYGDGSQTRDFVHVGDLARLLAHLVGRPAAPEAPVVVNCGTGERTSLLELALTATAASPVGGAGIAHLAVHRAGDIEHACADLTHLRALGAPAPQRSSEDAVREFIRDSWDRPGAAASTWDAALAELAQRGLTS